jgi:biotin carboxylase
MSKKLMLLGGTYSLLPVIKKAHELGIYVITVDYLPDNLAHKYSDKYCNVSVVDEEAVLRCAREEKIDGILSFGCDAGAVSAAYVAEKLGLTYNGPYESVRILQNKGLFRQFLTTHGFNVPVAKSYTRYEEVAAEADLFNWPVIVKPVDSAGSKGVTRVETPEGLKEAVDTALHFSRSSHFIVEDFLEKEGRSSDTDCMTVNGELRFCSFNDQWFDEAANNPYAPSAYSWPCTMPVEAQLELKNELQRLMTLLNMQTGIYNIETRLCKNGKPYIMEVSPRGGGNCLAEMLGLVTDVDLIEKSIRAAVGEDNGSLPTYQVKHQIAEFMLHTNQTGKFESIQFDPAFERQYVRKVQIFAHEGDEVKGFSFGGDIQGSVAIEYKDQEELQSIFRVLDEYIQIRLKK